MGMESRVWINAYFSYFCAALSFIMDYLFILISQFFTGFTVPAVIAIAVLCFLLYCSGLMSASETAYFSLQPSEIAEIEALTSAKARTVMENRSNPKRLLATVLIGNNLVNVTIVMLSNYIMVQMFNLESNAVIAFFVQVIVFTSIILIFGEIVPKVYAAKHAKTLALRLGPLLKFLIVFFKPLSSILVGSTSFIDRRLAGKARAAGLSKEDISKAIDITTSSTPIEEKNMLKGIATFSEKEVGEIMKPRISVVAVSADIPFGEMLRYVVENGFSRVPVYRDSLDNVLGMLYIRELLSCSEDEKSNWTTLVRPAIFVPENMKINDLFQEFRAKKIHIAVVVDEYGGTSGIVTLEDVIEEIVGDIKDEFDEDQDERWFVKMGENVYLFKAQTTIIDFCSIFGLGEDAFDTVQGEADTLAGLLLEIYGGLPGMGWSHRIRNFVFEVVEADNRRLKSIKVVKE